MSRQLYRDFNVTLSGPAIGGVVNAQNFHRVGHLYLTDTITTMDLVGGVNAADFFLASGDPAGHPEPGAIYFATNTAALPDGADFVRNAMLDLARKDRFSGNQLIVKPAKRSKFFLYFTAARGLTASLYDIVKGTIKLTFNSDRTVINSGTLNLQGRPAGYPSSPLVTYHAQISGQQNGTVSY